MKRFFSWVMVLGACVGLVYGVGLVVPRSQKTGCKTSFSARPEQVYALVADPSIWPKWHPDVSSVRARPDHAGNPVWSVTTRQGQTFELETTASEQDSIWQGAYAIDDSRYTLRLELSWLGEGARVRLNRTIDTRDPWMRAKRFFLAPDEASPLQLINALADFLGESPTVQEN